jgi:hypothetical protein
MRVGDLFSKFVTGESGAESPAQAESLPHKKAEAGSRYDERFPL